MMKRASKILAEKGLLSWDTLVLGYQNGFATRNDVIEYAMAELELMDEPPMELALLAGGEGLDENEFIRLMQKLAGNRREMKDTLLDKWRLALLTALQRDERPIEDKIDALQEIYAAFDYPDDMEKCSVYYMTPEERSAAWRVGDQLTNDPYKEMLRVIESLETKLQPSKKGHTYA